MSQLGPPTAFLVQKEAASFSVLAGLVLQSYTKQIASKAETQLTVTLHLPSTVRDVVSVAPDLPIPLILKPDVGSTTVPLSGHDTRSSSSSLPGQGVDEQLAKKGVGVILISQ